MWGDTHTRYGHTGALSPSRSPLSGYAAPERGFLWIQCWPGRLPGIHELPLDDSSGDADSKVDAHPPCPFQIGVCPQSRTTPDLGTPTLQLTAVGHTQDRAATRTAAVIPHHSLDAENAFLNREEDPAHSLWASCSEPPAPRHNTNATADLSASYGISATLGQHKTCPDRDDSQRTRSVTTPPPFPPRMTSAPLSSHLNTHMPPMTRHLHTSVMTSSFSGTPLAFSQWTRSPFTKDLVEYNCAEQFMMASKARLFGDDTALSAILASNDPREQKRLGRRVHHFDHELWQSHCENIVLQGTLAKFSQNNEMRLALLQTGDRRLAKASPHDNLWGIGLSACDPRASSPDSWCGKNLLGQALENAANSFAHESTAPPDDPAPETPAHGMTPATRSSRWIRLLISASTRPHPPPMPKRPRSRLSPNRCPMTMPLRYLWLKISAQMRPPFLNKALTCSVASSPWTTPRSPHY